MTKETTPSTSSSKSSDLAETSTVHVCVLLTIHSKRNPASIYLFKVNNRDSGVFIVKFDHISHLFLVFLLLTLSNEILTGKFA